MNGKPEFGNDEVFYPPDAFRGKALIANVTERQRLAEQAKKDPEDFWAREACALYWFKEPTTILDADSAPFYRWFEGGQLNASYNCLDRHVRTSGDKPAIIWQGEPEDEVAVLTYSDLYRKVNSFAYFLRDLGVKRGDRVCMYMPMIPALPIAMLACARIGAVHSVVFSAFSPDSLATRIQDAEASVIITVDGYYRGGKTIDTWANACKAIAECPTIKRVVVVPRLHVKIASPTAGPDFVMWDPEDKSYVYCTPEDMDSTDPLFILYTSGSTGKPKGIVHSTGGYLVYAASTFKMVFDHHDDDIFWCTADIGWITGHSYITYGPLANGATVVMFEGVPTYPEADRFWKIIEKFGVTVFYTAPTAIRSLMKVGDEFTKRHDLSSLRLLGTVGEPINPEAWRWYYKTIGQERCPIVDTWWQTETGGILISPLPGATAMKPGSATLPLPGIEPKVLRIKQDEEEREEGHREPEECDAGELGYLVISKPWPGMMMTVLNDPDRYRNTYFKKFGDKYYFTGDGAIRDKDDYFWLMGRVDDVLLVSGHNIGTGELEHALVGHGDVAEAAVVGYPHPIKGQGIYAFIILKANASPSADLKASLAARVRAEIGPHAKPDKIQFVPELPKTRSGKIMRRILKKIAAGDEKDLGDTTTLIDPSIVDKLVKGKV